MLQLKNLLMERGTLLGKEPREGRKVLATIGFFDFVAAVSVVFSGCCPAAVSDSETVFLCPASSLAAALRPVTRGNDTLAPRHIPHLPASAGAATLGLSSHIGCPLPRQEQHVSLHIVRLS
ncbi:hypothetical protein [Hymenobacter pini]|uniref:hypothetical protein n=1 Tax=Hymenobacter pini TaxID=2880879 RepID=UPI001CF51F82|nr:hypothetical protein [Hymenobacter pini]